MYQDIWRNGKLIQAGDRECQNRYEIIKSFCELKFHEPFSVCDIGANMAYFGIRLIEDFDCWVMAFEFHQFENRVKEINKNKLGNKLMYINRKITLNDLSVMNHCCKFDLILATSVLHHVTEPVQLWIDGMKNMCKYLIVEFAGVDSELTTKRKEYILPPDGIVIGHGDSHLEDNFKRPIILYHGKH